MEGLGINGTSLSVEKVAEQFNVGTRTIINYLHSGKLKGKKVGKTWHIFPESVKQFLGEIPTEGGELQKMGTVRERATDIKGINIAAFRRVLECCRLVVENKELLGGENVEKLNSYLHYTMESMIGGYFSYGQQKVMHYQQSKDGIARGLALLYMHTEEDSPVLQSFLEALNATVALYRRIQNENKKRSKREE